MSNRFKLTLKNLNYSTCDSLKKGKKKEGIYKINPPFICIVYTWITAINTEYELI